MVSGTGLPFLSLMTSNMVKMIVGRITVPKGLKDCQSEETYNLITEQTKIRLVLEFIVFSTRRRTEREVHLRSKRKTSNSFLLSKGDL